MRPISRSLSKISIDIIHGPNLNMLGKRQPEIYGNLTFETVLEDLKSNFTECEITYFQSNIEGEIIDYLQQTKAKGIVINAGGYSHTSVAIADAIAAIDTPCFNVHISNIYQREPQRHVDLISKNCVAGIYGAGFFGYECGIEFIINLLNNKSKF